MKATTRTCTVPTWIDGLTINNRLSAIKEGRLVIEDEKKMFLCPQWWVLARCRRGGLVLIELLMVVALLGLMTGIAMLGFGAMWGDTHFKSRAEQLVNTFQMAYEAALQSDRRYAVILDQLNNVYILRQFETLDLQTLPDDEAIITVGRFDEDFQFDYVLYDDLEDTRE
ncbi:MAG: hypothetical protein GX298_09745, partial [Planctomycetes bacterium]|nr:hypothetical protein [Planctomycetota bacterium]